MRIYFAASPAGFIYGDGYLCRGILMEDNPRCVPTEHELICQPDWAPSSFGDVLIYRNIDAASASEPWYLSQEEAAEASNVSPSRITSVYLHTDVIEPLHFPLLVDMQVGEKGYFIRLNSHPELDGRNAKGKIFFPDRSWNRKDIDKGPAMVSISKEFQTYGFLKGEMVSFEAQSPEYSDFLDWAWDNKIKNSVVAIIQHPIRGEYYAVLDSWSGKYKRVCKDPQAAGGITTSSDNIIQEDMSSGCGKQLLELYDLFTLSSFDMTRDALSERFPTCKFFKSGRIEAVWVRSDRLQTPIIEEGIKAGALSLWELRGFDIPCITVSRDSVVNLCSFPANEVDEMVEAVTKLNKDAEEQILTKVRKGRIRMRNLV